MKCPYCDGEGGTGDGWYEEWVGCPCCNPKEKDLTPHKMGIVSARRFRQYEKELIEENKFFDWFLGEEE